MSAIQSVTIVGASGRLGGLILDRLVTSNKFRVQVLTRGGASFPINHQMKVVEADYDDVDSLTAAFQGQDAIVSVVGDAGVPSQKLMVDAAVAARVKRFLPSDFGSNLANVKTRELPVFASKIQIEEYLIEKSKTTDLTYSFVYVGGLTDFAIPKKVIMDFSKYSPKVFNGGTVEFSSTSMSTVGKAVLGVLTHLEATQNRTVYVSECILSQRHLLSLAQKVAPDKPWAPVDVDLNTMVKAALEHWAQGERSLSTAVPLLLKSIVDPEYGSKFDVNDNELLGIEPTTEEYLMDLVASTIPA
jgi:uncharacterized protein YbjT (DUF2867 family)